MIINNPVLSKIFKVLYISKFIVNSLIVPDFYGPIKLNATFVQTASKPSHPGDHYKKNITRGNKAILQPKELILSIKFNKI